jgi:cytochrome P450
VSFSKGSRPCLGLNLAYAEIYLCVANLVNQFPKMQLLDTVVADAQIQADYYVPKASGRGVRVLLN